MPRLTAAGVWVPNYTQGVAAAAADVNHAQSNTTLSDVTGLLVPVSASATERWFVEAFLVVVAASTTDMKFGWTVPAGATMQWGVLANISNLAGFAPGNTTVTPSALASESQTVSIGTANATFGVSLAAMLLGGGTAGNAQLQFAPLASEANTQTVKAGSFLRFTRLAA